LLWVYPIDSADNTQPSNCTLPEDNYNAFFECRCRPWYATTKDNDGTITINEPYMSEGGDQLYISITQGVIFENGTF